MTNKKRLAAVILAAIVLFALMTSLIIIIHEADHECTGAHCPICTVIALCQNTLKTLCGALISAVFAFGCFSLGAEIILFFRAASHNDTPVSLKVKLLN